MPDETQFYMKVDRNFRVTIHEMEDEPEMAEETRTMVCRKCGKVYDVETRSEKDTWLVVNPEFGLVVDFNGDVRPIDYEHANQLQAAVEPMCLDTTCLGYLDDKPIRVKISKNLFKPLE